MLGDRFSQALVAAHELHAHQWRKAQRVPYVSHLLAVTALVLEYGGDEDEAIAALLHDAIEDCGGLPTAAQLRERFGDRVVDIVLECSDTAESPKPPWRARKEAYLHHLGAASPSALLVSACDKLHNLRSLVRDEALLGEGVWVQFRSGRDGALWYFRELVAVFEQTQLPSGLVAELCVALQSLNAAVPGASSPSSASAASSPASSVDASEPPSQS